MINSLDRNVLETVKSLENTKISFELDMQRFLTFCTHVKIFMINSSASTAAAVC